MTNSVVYWSFLHLDAFFINWWNLVRNFANFWLAFLLVYQIFQALLTKKTTEFKNVIKRVLVAGVLIQMSWFLIGAMLDVSTILVSSIGTFPWQVLVKNSSFRQDLESEMKKIAEDKVEIIIKEDSSLEYEEKPLSLDTKDDINWFVDTILPNENSLSGPLLFLGLSMMDIQNDSLPHYNENLRKFFEDLTISGIKILAFSVMLLLLFIFNFLRVFALWIVIPLSPILILLKVMKIKIPDGEWGLKWIFDVMNIIKLIFMPVIFVTYLSVVIMFLVSMKGVIQSRNMEWFYDEQSQVGIKEYEGNRDGADGESEKYTTSTLSVGNLFSWTMVGLKNGFSELLLFLFTILLLWKLIILTFQQKTGIAFIDNTMKGLTGAAEKMLTSIPFIPAGGGLSLRWVSKTFDKVQSGDIHVLNKMQSEQDNRVRALLGLDDITTVWSRLANDVDPGKFYNDSKTRQELISYYTTQKSTRDIKDMPVFMEWFKKHAVWTPYTWGRPTDLQKVKIASWKNISVSKVLQEFRFNSDGKYVWWGTSPKTSSVKPSDDKK